MESRQRLRQIHDHPAFPTVERIIVALAKTGFDAVLAGGCVRDALLGYRPKDLDVASSAPPEIVERLFTHTLAVGKAFGTMVVVENGFNIEVTTFRSEGEYLDGRHPSRVDFTSMEVDAKRRDFTVNALYYDPESETVFDFVAGIEDLRRKQLRCVGRPAERFQEDHLRILRAARFVAQLGFNIDPETFSAMRDAHQSVSKVSAERIFNEMKRMLESRFLRAGLRVLQDAGLAEVVWPEIQSLAPEKLDSFLSFLNWENAFSALCLLSSFDPEPRLRAWKASRDSLKEVQAQLEKSHILLDPGSSPAQRILALGGPCFASVMVLVAGILEPQGEGQKLHQWIQDYLNVVGPSGELPKPWIEGGDLLAEGVQPSPAFGRALKAAYEAQLERRARSRKDALQIALAELKK